jgi:hypothetical protein
VYHRRTQWREDANDYTNFAAVRTPRGPGVACGLLTCALSGVAAGRPQATVQVAIDAPADGSVAGPELPHGHNAPESVSSGPAAIVVTEGPFRIAEARPQSMAAVDPLSTAVNSPLSDGPTHSALAPLSD